MKKALIALFLMSCLLNILSAQITNFPFTEGFEGSQFPPAGWVRAGEHTVEEGNWHRAMNTSLEPNIASQGIAAAVSRSWLPPPPLPLGTPINPNNWLITPQLSIPNDPNFILNFQTRSDLVPEDLANLGIYFGEEQYTVYVSTQGNSISDFTTALFNETFPKIGQEYIERSLNLSGFGGQNIYIAFRHHDCENNGFLAIDDIWIGSNLPTNPPRDLIASASDGQATLSWTAPEGDRKPIEYRIYNDGIPIKTVDTLTHTLHNLVNGIDYNFAIRALYSSPLGESLLSNVVAVKPVGNTIYPIPPFNLTATQFDGDVTLTWEVPTTQVPLPLGGMGFFHPIPGYGGGDMVLPVGAGAIDVPIGMAQRYSVEALEFLGIAGGKLAGVLFYSGDQNSIGSQFIIRIFTGGTSMTDPGTMVHEQYWGVSTSDNINRMVEVGLTTQIDIPRGQELRILVLAKGPGHPLGYGLISKIAEYGNLVFWQDEYLEISSALENVQGNAYMAGYAFTPTGRKVLTSADAFMPHSPPTFMGGAGGGIYHPTAFTLPHLPHPDPYTPSPRNFITYRIYRGDQHISIDPHTETTFTDKAAPSGNQTYYISAFYEGVGESVKIPISINVTTSITIEDYPFTESFEGSTFPPNGWSVHDIDGDGRSWTRQSQGAFQGNAFTGSHSWLSTGALTPDNWLISPRFKVPPTGPFALRYYVGAYDGDRFAEHYSVLVSTTTPHIDQFKEVLLSETLSQNEWVPRWIDLSKYAGQTIIIAFRHYDCTNQNMLKIDEILLDKVTNENDPIVKHLGTSLNANYPNPFNPSTVISFDVGDEFMMSSASSPHIHGGETHIRIDIYNIRGQRVRNLVNDSFAPGSHRVEWNGKDDSGNDTTSGVYFYQMRTDYFTSTRKMLLLR